METIKEKIAYLRGVMDGDSSLQEGRVRFLFEKTLKIIAELAEEVEELTQTQVELDDYLQEVDLDLAYLEDEFFAQDDECGCHDNDEDWDDWEDCCGTLVEVECPECQEIVSFDEDFLFDQGVQICCPRCDAVVFETDDFDDLDDVFLEDGVEED